MRLSRALRCASTRAVGAPLSRAQRPERRHDLIQMGTANAGRTLEQLQAIGHEHAQQRTLLDVEQALDGRPVGAHALGLPRLEPNAQLVGVLAIAQLHAHARGTLPEAHQLALVAGARRASGAAEVQRLQQVGLAGAVRSVHDGQALPQRRLGAGVGTEVAQLHAGPAPHLIARARHAVAVGQADQETRGSAVVLRRE